MRGKKAKVLRRAAYGGEDYRERQVFAIDRSKVVSTFKDGAEVPATVRRFQAVADATRTKYQHAKKK